MTIPIKRIVDSPDGNGTIEEVAGVMFTSISNNNIVDTLEMLRNRAYVLLSFSMFVMVVCAFGLSRILVIPFKCLSVSIRNIKNGYLYFLMTT